MLTTDYTPTHTPPSRRRATLSQKIARETEETINLMLKLNYDGRLNGWF